MAIRSTTLALLSAFLSLVAGTPWARAESVLRLSRADGASVPISAYGQQNGCPPTLIISHGLGGSERAGAGLARALAGGGWRVLVMGHKESGPALLRQAIFSGTFRDTLIAFATEPPRHRARALDLDAAYAEATRVCRPPRLLLAGHSMGAVTTMMEAGAVARFGRFGADRFDSYVAISPQGIGTFWSEGSWAKVTKPVLMVTGTRDHGADGDYTTRLEAFRRLQNGPHRLAIIDRANHIALSASNDAMGRLIAALVNDFVGKRESRLDGVRVDDRTN